MKDLIVFSVLNVFGFVFNLDVASKQNNKNMTVKLERKKTQTKKIYDKNEVNKSKTRNKKKAKRICKFVEFKIDRPLGTPVTHLNASTLSLYAAIIHTLTLPLVTRCLRFYYCSRML